MKLSFAASLLVLLLLTSSFLVFTKADYPTSAPIPGPAPSFCDQKCGARCADAGYQDRCMKYCQICCQDCKCVPSGTYGNKSECPCYRDKLNSKGKPKCP